MKKSSINLKINEFTGGYEIIHKGFSWVSDGRTPYIIIRKKISGKYISTYRTLYSAPKRNFEYSDGKIVTRLSGYVAFGKVLDFTLVLTAEITGEDTAEFSLKAENETGCDIQAVYFPAPFNSKKKGRCSYHVDAMRQGFLLPDGYKENFASTFGFAHYLRKINTGDCYMPIWGRVCDGHSFSAIVETPYDACMFSSFGKHRAFVNSVHWMSSLGKLSYERKIKFVFHESGDYNTVAKDYRRYLIETNQFVSIDDKIEKNKNIEKLIGCSVLHHKIYSKINEKSKFYDKNGTNETLYATFYERAEQIKKLSAAGLEKLYIHTDGWGKDGYDNNHPYILPPCESAGGWEGFREFSKVSRELGYIFALHDQYRDYYYSSPGFDMDKAVMRIDSSHPYCSIWDGGEHTFLCASQALEFVKRTYSELENHGVDVQGAYLDVFSVMNGDECFNPKHKITREQSIQKRAECFDYLNEKGLIMSSEEPAMQLLNHIALVHHGPFTLRPQENGLAVGIPVPLGNLVFHDCIMVPWNWFNNWGIPKGDNGDLYCALCAGMPYIHPFGTGLSKIGTDSRTSDTELLDDDKLKKEIERVKPLADLQAKLYNIEMIKHEFLGSTRRQKATYADGTTVTVDLDKNVYEVGESD
ncbi:MAG: DUF5696 domain-containing protein [Acutalibacteraceae bacterium]